MWRKIRNYIKEKAGGYLPYRKQVRFQSGDISLLNWWEEYNASRLWLKRFIEFRGLAKGKTVDICSLFGPRSVLGWSKADIRIFFSGENLHLPRWSHYADYMLSGSKPFDLALGYDYFEDGHYLRFPLWIMYLFPPDASEKDIERICDELRHPKGNTGAKFCSLISRWDPSGVRKRIYDALGPFGQIDCPSAFLHNDNGLKNLFGDDKCAYLKQYKFNICPENSNAAGYTTEKIFESISSGCIPIYSGSFGHPEPEVINPEAVLIWNDSGENDYLISKISELSSIPSAYDHFAAQPRLVEGAEDFIIRKFKDLGKAFDYIHRAF